MTRIAKGSIRFGKVRVRVKRRGRVLLVLALVTLAVLGLPRIFAVDAEAPGGGMTRVVVQAGDTLWDLAKAHGPAGVDPRRTVDRIRRVNGLTTARIHPGQELLIPTR